MLPTPVLQKIFLTRRRVLSVLPSFTSVLLLHVCMLLLCFNPMSRRAFNTGIPR